MENIEQIKISNSKITRYQSRILVKSVNDVLSAASAGSRNILLAKLASFDSNICKIKNKMDFIRENFSIFFVVFVF